jgi:enoyl-CoA hydratase/carnithine racemase
MSEEGRISSRRDGAVLVLSIDRPSKKNSFTLAMYEALVAELEAGASDDSVRVVVIRGEGGSFTGGNDLGDFMRQPPTSADTPVFRLLQLVAKYEKPLLAAVVGPAIGIGTTLLLHCDLVWAAENAKFRMPFVDLGLVPEGGSSYLLPRMMGHVKAAELLLLSEPFDGKRAAELGIVNGALPEAEVDAHVLAKAHALAAKAPEAVRLAKQLLKAPNQEPVHETLFREGALFMQRLVSAEAREAFTAFFEKRAPKF